VITAKAFAGKHYAVLGLARSGLATVEALLASGARVTAWDEREEARDALSLSPSGERVGERGMFDGPSDSPAPSPLRGSSPPLKGRGQLSLTDFTTADLTQFDSIVVTPGLPLNRHPIAARAREAGVEIIGDIELFARARPELPPHKVVGITGTNGKSTTTALVHHILQTAGVPSLMGGNIGLPILSQNPLPDGGVYVLELSSYQIDLTKSLDCDVAVLLNITPDHLDRYESFEAYAASKRRLFEMQEERKSLPIDLSLKWTLPPHVPDGDDMLSKVLKIDPGHKSWPRQRNWPALKGPHNAENAFAAHEVCLVLGIDKQVVEQALRTYPGLPHRMERILDRDGVLFVNDSKATNAEAAAPALAAYPRVRWIVGGQAKAETLGDTARHLDHVVKAYAIGEAGAMFARLLREAGVDVVEAGTLDAAVRQAADEARPGETVLLSPAAASFDQFRDFEDRGDRFRALVMAL
jgi:UDP-N-acetylmuramoylalanine--D-glutamate ligase